MRVCLALCAAVLCVASAGCGGGDKYPVNVESNFLNGCETTGGDTGNCQCALDWLERHVPLERFQVDEDGVRSGGVPGDVRRAIGACR